MAVLVLLLATCGERDRTPVIGSLMAPPVSRIETFARAVVDSLAVTELPGVRLASGVADGRMQPLANVVERALRLAPDSAVFAMVGPPSSTEALLVAPILAEAGVPLLVPTATSGKLKDAGATAFPMAPNDSVEGDFLATFAADSLHARTATIFHVVDDYGSGLDASTAAALERQGVRVLDRVPIRVDLNCAGVDPNPYELLVDASLRRGTPDVVIVAARLGETACLAATVAARVPGAAVVAADGAAPMRELREAVTALSEVRLFAVSLWNRHAGARAAAFASGFEARYGYPPDAGDALLYDAICIVAEAGRRAGTSRQAVLRHLRALGSSLPPYEGVTGPIAFTPGWRRPLYMVRIRDGVIVDAVTVP